MTPAEFAFTFLASRSSTAHLCYALMFVETLEDVQAAGVGPRLLIAAENLSSCLEAMRCGPEGPGPTTAAVASTVLGTAAHATASPWMV